MSTRIALFIAALGLLWLGEERIRTALSNRELVTMKAADYTARKPDARWLELTDCFPFFLEAAVKEESGKIVEVFIPLRPLGDDGTAPVHVVIASRDARHIALVQQLHAAGDTEARVKIANENNARGLTEHSVRGLVRRGLDLDTKERTELANLRLPLTSDFVILGQGQEPSLASGLLFTSGGLGILAYFLIRGLRSRATAAPAV